MAVRLQPRTAIVVLGIVLLVGAAGSTAVAHLADGQEYDPTRDFVTIHEDPSDDDTLLWLYTSPTNVYDHRTLGINVVVYGNPERTEHYLTETARGDWNETTDADQDVAPVERSPIANATTTEWRQADGAIRYAYVRTGDAAGRWMTESYQLHDGDYLGMRHHVRAYRAPDDREAWTAMQAHREHWNWFQIRHVVDSVEESQSYVEAEFMDRVFVEDVWRAHLGNDVGSDANGWVTIVDLAGSGDPPGPPWTLGLLPVIALGATAVRRVDWLRERAIDVSSSQGTRSFALVAGIVTLVLGVRFGAIGAERALPLPPKAIAAVFYPFVFAGLPIAAYLLARQLDRPFAFAGASMGFLVASLLDYTYLGVTVLPLDVLVHHGALAVALGFVAVGASPPERRDPATRNHVRIGVLLWLVATLLPLLRFTPLPV